MRQPDLFRSMCAEVYGSQQELFIAQGAEVDLHCEECGEYMVRTPSGFLSCPNGHGKLIEETPPEQEPCGSWFEPDMGGEA